MIGDLIAAYLFNYKNCPLPGVGVLAITQSHAIAAHGENRIAAPLSSIHFTATEMPAAHLITYIAQRRAISEDQAVAALNDYCRSLRQMDVHGEVTVAAAGKFFINSAGKLQFRQTKLPEEFQPSVAAQRVIHLNDSHDILVGDTRTTTAAMSHFLNAGVSSRKNRWLIWAIMLFVIAVAIISFYYNDKNSNASFGIAQSYRLAAL